MKLRELINKMEGVSSYGLYNRNGTTIEAFPTVKEIIPYLDYDVHHFKVVSDSNCKIRCLIYLDEGDEATLSTPFITGLSTSPSSDLNYDAEPRDVNPLSKGLYSDVKCPFCGSDEFILGSTLSTLVYQPTRIKGGKVVPSKNPNKSTTYCTCCKCGKEFTINENNEVNISDNTGPDEVVVINMDSESAFKGVPLK